MNTNTCGLCKTNIKNSKEINEKCLCKVSFETEFNNFFASAQVYISNQTFFLLKESISKIEQKLKENPDIANVSGGIVMSYDFHLENEIPKLIEINTNAGGMFLGYKGILAAKECCSSDLPISVNDFEDKIFQMFKKEYEMQNGLETLNNILILDENPEGQFLYPDFLICKKILEKKGLQVFITSPDRIIYSKGKIYFNEHKIDFIYNRLTDFSFQNYPDLKKSFEDKNIVISPNPNDYKYFADKRKLIFLSSDPELKDVVPETVLVNPENSDNLWLKRKEYFFKPTSGYGGKGAYNGKGITKKVWEYILSSNYVAQKIVPANLRKIRIDNIDEQYKYDIRVYTYTGQILLIIARVYSGQTTNFRTKGGGFAPIFLTEK